MFSKYAKEFGYLGLPEVTSHVYGCSYKVPVIDHPDARVLKHVEADLRRFHMDVYACDEDEALKCSPPLGTPEQLKGCGTVHCMAGWLIHICGEQGYRLSELVGNETMAATLIYKAAMGDDANVPCFKSSMSWDIPTMENYNAYNLELLRERAAADPLPE